MLVLVGKRSRGLAVLLQLRLLRHNNYVKSGAHLRLSLTYPSLIKKEKPIYF